MDSILMNYVCVTHIGSTYTRKDMFLLPFMVLAQVLYLYCYSSISNLSFFSFLSPSLSLFFPHFLCSLSLSLSSSFFLVNAIFLSISLTNGNFLSAGKLVKSCTHGLRMKVKVAVLPKAGFIFLAFYISNNASLF